MTITTPRLLEKGHKSQGHSRDSDVWGSKLIFRDVKTKTYTFLFQVIIQRVWAHGEGSSSGMWEGNGINKDVTPLDQTLWGGGRDPWATWRRSTTLRRLQQLQCWPWPGAPSARMVRKTGLHGVPLSGLHGEATSVLRPTLDQLCPPPSPSSELRSCHLNNTCKPILRAPPGQLAHRQTWPSHSAEVQSHMYWRLRFCTQLLQLATSTFFFYTFPHPKPPILHPMDTQKHFWNHTHVSSTSTAPRLLIHKAQVDITHSENHFLATKVWISQIAHPLHATRHIPHTRDI